MELDLKEDQKRLLDHKKTNEHFYALQDIEQAFRSIKIIVDNAFEEKEKCKKDNVALKDQIYFLREKIKILEKMNTSLKNDVALEMMKKMQHKNPRHYLLK